MATHKFDKEDKKEEIRNILQKTAKRFGKTQTIQEFKRSEANISFDQIVYYYGSWNEAIKDAGLEINPTKQPPSNQINKQELIDEFIRVANELGVIPGSHLVFQSKAKFSVGPYKTTFGSWKKTVEYIVDNYKDKFIFKAERKEKRMEITIKNRKLLKFLCPLLYTPQNESETIALFCYLAPRLGYMIKNVRAEFPDAVLIKDGQEIKCEFEYLSSNYIQHGHSQDGSCICICWRKDIEVKGVEVFSLEEYLRENHWFEDKEEEFAAKEQNL